MFAVVETGGKQYKVEVGQYVEVEKLENNVGDKINLNVLLLSDGENVKTGNPYVEGCTVEAEVVEHGKGDKIVVFKLILSPSECLSLNLPNIGLAAARTALLAFNTAVIPAFAMEMVCCSIAS